MTAPCGTACPAPATPAPADTRIAVVVLTWNAAADTLRCLEALLGDLAQDDAVWVVDNGSEDGTEDQVRTRFPAVRFLQNHRNLGFAAGSNAGLRRALEEGFDWCWLLNNDTVPPPGALPELRRIAARARGVGALQPLLVSAESPDLIDSAGHALERLPGVEDLASGKAVSELGADPRPIFGACGAAALLRSDALRDSGLLDEDLFVLFEDVDLMFRLRAHGWEIELHPSLRIPHRRGVSAPGARSRRAPWVHRNLMTLALRWWPAAALLRGAPSLTAHALRALWCSHGGPLTCLRLWSAALRSRRSNRRRLVARGVDRWFGAG